MLPGPVRAAEEMGLRETEAAPRDCLQGTGVPELGQALLPGLQRAFQLEP